MPLRMKLILIISCTALLAALYLLTPRQFRFTLERHDAPEIDPVPVVDASHEKLEK